MTQVQARLSCAGGRGSFGVLYVGQFVAALLLMGFLGGLMLFVLPKFREVYNDFRAPLPLMTEWLMVFGDWYAARGGWVVTPLVAMLVPLPVAWRYRGVSDRKVIAVIILVSVGVQLVVTLVVVLGIVHACFLPLDRMIEAVPGGR